MQSIVNHIYKNFMERIMDYKKTVKKYKNAKLSKNKSKNSKINQETVANSRKEENKTASETKTLSHAGEEQPRANSNLKEMQNQDTLAKNSNLLSTMLWCILGGIIFMILPLCNALPPFRASRG